MRNMLSLTADSYLSMAERSVINFSFIILGWAFLVNVSYAQVNINDPATWPKPSLDNVRDQGFYNTEQKLQRYYIWKKKWELENLPPLFLNLEYFDDEEITVKKHGDEEKYIIDINETLPFILTIEPQKIPNSTKQIISRDSISNLSFKDKLWLTDFLKSKNASEICYALDEISSHIYLIIHISETSTITIREVINCVDGFSLADDEVTDYELIRKGDSLIIIEPKN